MSRKKGYKPTRPVGRPKGAETLAKEAEAGRKLHEALNDSSMLFGSYYLTHHFRMKSPRFHQELTEHAKDYQYLAVAAPRGHAKAQPMYSSILTPDGWKQMFELNIDDKVIGSDGRPTTILGVFSQGEKDIYEVKTSDDRITHCCGEHLWTVQTPSNTNNKFITKTTEELLNNYKSNRHDKRNGKDYIEYRHFLPTVSPVEFKEKELLIDPYTLGAWLGDGNSSGGVMTSDDEEILSYFTYKWKKRTAKFIYGVYGLLVDLRKLNLLNNKHIPNEYMVGSVKQREALLQGLIDTDGYIQADGHIFDFTQKNQVLMNQVIELIRSLGGTCKKQKMVTKCNGKYFESSRITCKVPDSITPCRLKRKLSRWKGSLKTRSPIVNIKKIGKVECQCIRISNEDGLYVTDDYILTHNTSILGFNHPLHSICFKKRRFIVYFSNTFKQATLLLHSLKQEMKENKLIIQDFRIKITKDAEDIAIFRHPDGFETMVLCLGADQMGNVRGRKFGAYRPDLFIIDDVENDELVRSPDRRLKLQEDFDNAVIPAGDVDTQFVFVGTILHDDSLLAKVLNKDIYTEFHKVFYRALSIRKSTKEYVALWPEKMSVETLMRIRKEKPFQFAKEYQNDPSSSGTEEISKKDFRYWRIENMQYILFDDEGNVRSRGDLKDCRAAISCDLAWEDKKTSDFTAVVPGFLTPNSELLLDTYINKKGMRPNELEELLFTMEDRLRSITGSSVYIGFEKAKHEKITKWMLGEAMKRRNHYLLIKDLQWGSDKIERIMTKLQPRYAQHSIYHKHGMGELETQLTRLRSTTHDDLADAEQGLVQLLQYAKHKRKQDETNDMDNAFMRVRKFALQAKKIRGKVGRFSMNKKRHGIAAEISPI